MTKQSSNHAIISFRHPAVLISWLVLIATLLLSSGYLWLSVQKQSLEQSRDLGTALARQITLTLRPLVLAEDRISLNFVLQQMGETEQINGAHLLTGEGETLGKAGTEQGVLIRRTIVQEETTIATLSLWINEDSVKAPMLALLTNASVLLILSLLTAVIGFFLGLTLIKRAQYETLIKEDYPTLEPALPEQTLPKVPEISTLTESSPVEEVASSTLSTEEPSVTPEVTINTPAETINTAAEANIETVEQQRIDPKTDLNLEPTPPAETAVVQSNKDLVDLLKADKVDSPRFSPVRDQGFAQVSVEEDEIELTEYPYEVMLDDGDTQRFDMDDLQNEPDTELEESTPQHAEALSAEKSNPLTLLTEKYADSDLTDPAIKQAVSPEDAAYLLLVDATSAHSAHISAEERTSLIGGYKKLLEEAISVCSGNLEQNTEGDLLVRFTQPNEADEQGLRALCCAMLFNRLYRQFNQHQIRNSQPTLNLPTAIARGHIDQAGRLLEEARYLTQSTESNDLISHTALVEAEVLEATLLEGGELKRIEEDKVLILKLNPGYENWLTKQTDHLLNRHIGQD